MTITPQPPKKGRWYQAWYHFKHSNYITWFTDWLLTLGGKSAHSILIGTTLYMSAELYPGVNLPASLNIAVFLVQMFALDMGGMGLATLARQARADGNEDGADKAQKLSSFLIAIMIAGIVTVCVEQAISNFSLTADVQAWINAIKIIIEVSLVVSRAFCAVLYGVVIHALRADKAIHQQTQLNLQQEVADLTTTITALQQQQIARLQSEQKQVEHLRQQLESGQETTLTLRQQLNASHLQIADLSAKVEDANLQLHNLQKVVDETANLSAKLQAKEDELAGLRNELQAAKLQMRDMKSAKGQTAKTDKITSIETAKSNRISHAEVLAYMNTNPDMKRAEVATNLGISERKVYDAIAWRKNQEDGVASAHDNKLQSER